MGKPGIIAFPVLLALGAITGYLTYTYFTAAIPQEGSVNSPYRKELTASATNEANQVGDKKQVDETKFSNAVSIKILQGAIAQGSPDYDPDAAVVPSDALITWVNEDNTLHTATSGKNMNDPDKGKLFDTSYLQPGGKYSIPAADIGKGEHTYFCEIHPYMVGTVTIQ
jgi:plastocyanin